MKVTLYAMIDNEKVFKVTKGTYLIVNCFALQCVLVKSSLQFF